MSNSERLRETEDMVTISLCMIVKNEEDVLTRCLKSAVGLADEIIIVDTGSTDRTKEIALEFTDKVYDFDWIDDFAAARNFSFAFAGCEYCMWLDADDIFLEPDRDKFLRLKSTLSPETDVVMMKYNTGFDAEGNVTFSYFRERIVKNKPSMKWNGAVHEVIATAGKTEYSDCAVTHQKLHPSDTDRNLRIFEKLLQAGTCLDPRQQFYYGRELYYHKRNDDAIRVFNAFLDENCGWLENKIDACRHCAYCHYGQDCPDKALQSLLRSFSYGLPRAEVCCEIGSHFFDRALYPSAIYWYERALACKRDDLSGGFVSPSDYGYTPCIQLCVCYSRINHPEKAIFFNEMAAVFQPNSQAVAHNRAYFKTL